MAICGSELETRKRGMVIGVQPSLAISTPSSKQRKLSRNRYARFQQKLLTIGSYIKGRENFPLVSAVSEEGLSVRCRPTFRGHPTRYCPILEDLQIPNTPESNYILSVAPELGFSGVLIPTISALVIEVSTCS
jgi:hypothetical protein